MDISRLLNPMNNQEEERWKNENSAKLERNYKKSLQKS
jgi:hypothetical protein